MKHPRLVLVATAVVLAVPLALSAHAGNGGGGSGGGGATGGGVSVSSTFTLPVHTTGWVSDDSWCDNKGPHITIDTGALLGAVDTQVSFMNNQNDRSVYTVLGVSGFEVLSNGEGDTASVWKQPSRGGVAGNPYIYVDPDGNAGPASAIYIGRCVQDGKIGQLNHGHWSVDQSTLATSVLNADAIDCSNKSSSLTLNNDLSANAPTGNLIFSNSDLGLNPQHVNDSDIAAKWVFDNGAGLHVNKGGGATGAGGNPLVGIEFGTTDSTTTPPTFHGFDPNTYQQLGRCNKI